MKVLHVLRDLSKNGGVQRLVFDIVCAQYTSIQIDVLVTNSCDGADYISELQALGVTIYEVPRWKIFRLYSIFSRYDVVHAHLFPALYLAGLLHKNSFYTEHDTTNNRRNIRWSRPFESFIYKQFKCVTCISPEVQLELLKFLKWKEPKNTIVVYNGINLKVFSKLRKQFFKKDVSGRFNIAMVGSLTVKKGQSTIIRALSFLPDNVVLHLAGAGDNESNLKSLVKENSLDDRVVFHGLVNDIPEFLSKVDLYIQSSLWEGFGLAAIEAMACELPVLVTDVPGLNNLASCTFNLYAPDDVKQLVGLITKVREDDEFNNQLLTVSANTCIKFSLEKTISNFNELYQSSLSI